MVIRVLDYVAHCYTSSDGLVIASVLRGALRTDQPVTLSFDGVSDIPSSFANGAFVSLFDEFRPAEIKRLVRIVRSNRQVNDVIQRCVNNMALQVAAA